MPTFTVAFGWASDEPAPIAAAAAAAPAPALMNPRRVNSFAIPHLHWLHSDSDIRVSMEYKEILKKYSFKTIPVHTDKAEKKY